LHFHITKNLLEELKTREIAIEKDSKCHSTVQNKNKKINKLNKETQYSNYKKQNTNPVTSQNLYQVPKKQKPKSFSKGKSKF